jgi:ribonucleoside-diphosphate reductase beta chain
MNSNQLFNDKLIDFSKQPLFLGEGRNISRLDLNIEQHIQKSTDNAIGLMWFANDFTYTEDGKDFSVMDIKLQNLFLKNLKFQSLLDSLAARSVAEVFLPITTNPQLESWWYQHAFFENNIHSKTYAEIIKALPVNAKDVFDTIMIDENILNRAKSVIQIFEECVVMNARKILNIDYDLDSHKRITTKSLYALNILEAILFKSSFLTSFAYKENGIMNSTGDAIKKIQLDEIGHYSMTVNLINRLRVDPSWAHIFVAIEPEVNTLYKEAIEADYDWIDHLFVEGVVLLGISSPVLKGYVDYNAKVVMTSVGLIPLKEEVFNPCSWANKYTKSSNVQTAMKEKNNANYLLGSLDTYIPSDFWESL